MNRVTFTIIGYLLLLIGMISIILGFIGLSFKPLLILDRALGPLGSFIFKMVLIFGGMIMFYMSRMPPDEEDLSTD